MKTMFRRESTVGSTNRSAVSQHCPARDKRQLVANSTWKRELPSDPTILGTGSETNTLREVLITVRKVLSVWGDNAGKRLRSILVTLGAPSKPLGLSTNLGQFPISPKTLLTVLLASLVLSGCARHEMDLNKSYKEREKKFTEAAERIFDKLDNHKEGN